MSADQSELQDLYAASYARLVKVLTVAAGSRAEAEEAVQDAFVRAFRHWRAVRLLGDPEAWVRKAAFRLLANRFRKLRNGSRALARHGAAEDAAAPSGDRVDVVRALARIPAGQRHALVLHYMVGLDVAQVAAELGVPEGTVKSRLSRGRMALAPLLDEERSHA